MNMGYFDNTKNVQNYLKMSEGYDGQNLVETLIAHRSQGGSLLELGMGPGKDIDLLAPHFTVTGSDSSQPFLDIYLEKHPSADVLLLDAQTLETQRTFDVIYSNKVLHQLSPAALKVSFAAQTKRLNKGGLVMHSFWAGSGSESFDGDIYYYYQPETIVELLSDLLSVVKHAPYAEMETNDSFWIIAGMN
jgi:cyclopropane fatty-acyl-phospholipid synthase-like methyltransferase